MLIQDGQVVSSFPVLVGAADGPKERSMDKRTPEGDYCVAALLPDEAAVGAGYCKGLHVSYPAPKDIDRGLELGYIDKETHDLLLEEFAAFGVPSTTSEVGWNIAIHGGLAPDEKFERGTLGCVVLRNADMDVVYDFSEVGTPIVITACAGRNHGNGTCTAVYTKPARNIETPPSLEESRID